VLARNENLPVVKSSWVDECHKVGQRLPYANYLLPPLMGCLVSFTNIDKRDRARLSHSIVELGGRVAPDMTRNCSHLVAGRVDPPTAKLKCAAASFVMVPRHPTADITRDDITRDANTRGKWLNGRYKLFTAFVFILMDMPV
jgi:hypothetical protein